VASRDGFAARFGYGTRRGVDWCRYVRIERCGSFDANCASAWDVCVCVCMCGWHGMTEEWDKGRSPPPISLDFHFYKPTPSPFLPVPSSPSKQAPPLFNPSLSTPTVPAITSHHNLLLLLPVPSLIITPPPTIPPFLSTTNPQSTLFLPIHPRLLSETLKKKKISNAHPSSPIYIIFLLC